ncbi:MAG: 4'-phosphopantetheinyl transferase superfamily protein [Bryobacteraceae bacterium]
MGKPYLLVDNQGGRIDFSLSHARGCVACALGQDLDVGVDVDVLDESFEIAQFSGVFSSAEFDELRALGSSKARVERFLTLWTLKEAYSKATGQGLSNPFYDLSFSVSECGTVTIRTPNETGTGRDRWHFALASPTQNHRLAVAARAPIEDSCCFDLKPLESAECLFD